MLGTLVIVYALFHIEGAQALARSIYVSPRATPVEINYVIKEYGFNRPIWVQLWREIVNYAHLDFGRNPTTNQSVRSLIGQYLPRSLLLVGMSTLFALIIAVPLGVFQTVRRNKPSDYFFTGLTFVLYATPAFVLGILLQWGFEQHWHIFEPPNDFEGVWQLASNWRQITLPVITLSALTIAAFSRYMRSSRRDAMTEDYVRTARAKGASRSRVLFRHAFRNALIPIITLLGLSVPAIAGGAVITETVFNYQGMGWLTATSAENNQVQVVVGTTVVFTVLTVIGSLAADILYAVADPRIRYAKK